MDTKDLHAMRCEQTTETLLDKIDKILHNADDDGYLGHEDVKCIKNCWKAIWYAKQCCKGN